MNSEMPSELKIYQTVSKLSSNNLKFPEHGNYFVIAGNGTFLHKDNGVVSGLIPVDNISVLKDIEISSKCNLPKLKFEDIYKIKTFFQKVINLHNSESCVVLYFNKITQEYRVIITEQLVAYDFVYYDKVPLKIDDFVPVGTIHSHCFEAFHSQTDDEDEDLFDGVHITFGQSDKHNFTISASIVINGFRFKLDPLDFLEGIRWLFKETYELESPYVVKLEWDEEVDTWLPKVKAADTSDNFFCNKKSSMIEPGDQVIWIDELPDDNWKSTYGIGPFSIVSIKNDPSLGKVAIASQKVQGEFAIPLSFIKRQTCLK